MAVVPNPSDGPVTFILHGDKAFNATVRIWNVSGELVRELRLVSPAGEGSVTWYLDAPSGGRASAGLYMVVAFVQEEGSDKMEIRRSKLALR